MGGIASGPNLSLLGTGDFEGLGLKFNGAIIFIIIGITNTIVLVHCDG